MVTHGPRWLTAALIALALGAAPHVALAQPADAVPPLPDPGAPPPPPPPPPAPDPDVTPAPDDVGDTGESPEEFSGETIVITGSAIQRKELVTTAPVAIVTKVELDASGLTSVGDILQNLPSQSNAINVQSNNGGDGSTRINLRGLGVARTLVLVNGRRFVPGGTGANSSVDLNAIPLAAIERIEVLKDGASAIYGSDAVGGVVNIITRTNFNGSEVTAYTGSTQDGLSVIYDLNATTGTANDRGSILFSAGVYEQQPLFAGDRAYSTTDKVFDFEGFKNREDGQTEADFVQTLGSTSVPQGYINDRSGDAGNELWQQVINGPCDGGVCFNDPGVGWRNFNFDGVDSTGEGDLYNYQPRNYLVTPQQRYNFFSSGHYEVNDNVRGFFEATYTNRKSDQKLASTPLFTITEGISVSESNFYNPFGRSFSDMRRRFTEAEDRNFLQDLDTFRIVGGVDGSFPKEVAFLRDNEWKWSLSYNFGRTEGTEINAGQFNRGRVARALGPSFLDANGVARCGTPGNPDPDADCVPLNLFGGEGTITQEMLDYISYVGTARGFNLQQSVLFTATGKLVDTQWDGDVRLAVGAQYRDESGASIPDPLTAAGETTGNKSDPVEGGYDVREAYAELSIVPVTGREFADWVEANAAVRAFDYNTFGGGVTWKAGGLWRFVKGFSVRGTYSTAFRAPNVSELFSGQFDSFPNVTDPCDTSMGDRSPEAARNCSAAGIPDDYADDRSQILSLIGGNTDLDPETAKIFTAGVVFEPKQVPGLALTVDYFNVSLDQTITTVGAPVLLDLCYGADPAEFDLQSEECQAIVRLPNGFITHIDDRLKNIGGRDTAGIDVAIQYDHKTSVGRFVHNLEGTMLVNFDEEQANGEVVKGLGVYDLGVFPRWKANYSALWGFQQYGGGVNVRYIGSFRECDNGVCHFVEPEVEDPGNPAEPPADRNVGANVTADLYANYTINSSMGQSQLSVGVNNITNQAPAVIYSGFLATSDANTYDFLGRFFYARFIQRF